MISRGDIPRVCPKIVLVLANKPKKADIHGAGSDGVILLGTIVVGVEARAVVGDIYHLYSNTSFPFHIMISGKRIIVSVPMNYNGMSLLFTLNPMAS